MAGFLLMISIWFLLPRLLPIWLFLRLLAFFSTNSVFPRLPASIWRPRAPDSSCSRRSRRNVEFGSVQVCSGGWGGKLSSIMDWEDRTTCVLFGDGAGAVVLTKSGEGSQLLGFQCGADGSNPSLLHQPAGGSALPASIETISDRGHFLKMNGREIFKSAVRVMERAARELLSRHGLDKSQVNHVIPHQANARIVESLSQRLEIPLEKFYCNLHKYGNTSQLPFRSPWMKRSRTQNSRKVTLDCL